MHRILAAMFVLGVCASIRAQDVAPPTSFDAARATIAAEVAAGRVPSLAVAVVQDGELVWAEGFGLADVEHGVRASADTIYRLASISKPFTATAAMVLVERGDLDLDQPVNRYLEGPGVIAYRGRAEQVTLRRLMNHTAGLPTHWSFFYDGASPPPRQETIRRYGFAAWAPGTRTNYSNLALGIVDHVIARTSGRGFREFLVSAVLDPLRMARTDVGVRPGHEGDAAVGYRRDVGGTWSAVADYGFDHDGASAVRSSARDLMRFARLWIDGGTVDGVRVLGAASVAAMRERRGRAAGSDFGVGWGTGRSHGTAVLRHTGGMPGVSTVLQVFPERRAAVAVLANAGDRGAVHRSLRAILDVLLGPGASAPSEPIAVTPPPPAPGPAPAGTWRGVVEHFDGPLGIEVELGAQARVRFDARDVGRVESREATAARLRLRFDALLPTTTAFHGTPSLELDLEPDGDGWAGVLYADGDATFRLPHHVELRPAAKRSEQTLRVVTYNVLVGFEDYGIGEPYLPGLQRRTAVAAWLAAEAPDVVALQEMNGYTDERLRREAAGWGHAHAVVLKPDGYPVALTSSAPIEVVARLRDGLHHGFLHARTHGVDFVVVHVVPFAGVERKLRELESVLEVYRAAVDAGRPIVLLGDFNSIADADVDRYAPAAVERYRSWKYAFSGERPSETAVDVVPLAGAVDLYAKHRAGDAEMPLPRIDFVFASPDLAARSTGCRWLATEEFLQRSDHPPVVADLAWPSR